MKGYMISNYLVRNKHCIVHFDMSNIQIGISMNLRFKDIIILIPFFTIEVAFSDLNKM